jgi:hypothetical protein
VDFQDGFFVRGEILPNVGFSAKEPKTVAHREEYISYDVNLWAIGTNARIFVRYSRSQKEAFRSIFGNILNSSMMIEDIVGSYGKSQEYQLGELCLVTPPPKEVPDSKRGKICFVRECTAFVVLDEGNVDFDVSPLARYLDKKYKELTEELNKPPAFRPWTIPDKVEAKYESSTDKEVTLEKKEGGTVKVELAKLSKSDQLYVQRLVEVARYEAAEKTDPPLTTNPENTLIEELPIKPVTSVSSADQLSVLTTSEPPVQHPTTKPPPTAKNGSVLVSVLVTLAVLAVGVFFVVRRYWQ